MNDVFDKLNNCLNDGYSKLRSMRGADPNGFNYAMLENSLSLEKLMDISLQLMMI